MKTDKISNGEVKWSAHFNQADLLEQDVTALDQEWPLKMVD